MSAARDSTVKHMRLLLTGTAITSVALGAQAQGDPPAPSPTSAPPASSDDSYTEGQWHMEHAKDGGAGNPNVGYGVVDPMPEPSRNRGCGCHKDDPYAFAEKPKARHE